jgi:RNA polymerase sigma-70 factor (ECF subfamily)
VRKRETFRGEGPLEAWLWRTVVNAARTHRRSSLSPGFEIELAESWNGSADEAAERVRLAVSLLPEQQRHALFLHYYGDLGYRTLAETLGISPGTVGATLTAARESLRRLLEEVPR